MRYRFEIKVQRGETIESESISGVCVRPDGLIVIPIASNRLAPNTPILSNSRGATPVIVGSDDSHGLTLLKLSGPPRPWVKCWISQPMLDQELGYHQDGQGSWCQVTAVGCEYPKPLVGNDAFHIKLAQEGVAPERGGQLLTKEGALLGLVLERLNDQSEKKNRYPSAVVIPAVHIQKLIDDYRDKQLAERARELGAVEGPRTFGAGLFTTTAGSASEVVKQRRDEVAKLVKELPKGTVRPKTVLRALDDFSKVAPFGTAEWRLQDLMQFAEQSRGNGIISADEYVEIVTVHQKSRGSEVPQKRGGLQAQPTPNGPVVEPAAIPTPEQLKAQLKPFEVKIKAAMQRVRDLEPTFFKDRSNLKEMQQALQELTRTRATMKPTLKQIETIYEELHTEHRIAELKAKALEARVGELADKLTRGEATDAQLRAAMAASRKAPLDVADVEARTDSYLAVLKDIDHLVLRGAEEGLALPKPFSINPNEPQPTYDRAFAMAWLETSLQTKVEFVSLAGLDLPFKAALRVTESSRTLNAGDLIVTLLGEPFETLDQAVITSNGAKKRSETDSMESLVMYGGLSADLSEGDFVTGGTKNYLAPTAPTSEWYRFTIKVRRGEKFETESVSGTCVGPDGLVVIPIAANQLEPHTPIVNYGGPEVTVQIVGSDDRHGLTLLKLSGRLREWIKCNKTLPKLDQDLRIFRGTVSVNCLASAIGLAYPPPLEGNDAFQIRQYPGAQPLKRGDKVVSEENELLGLVLEPINDPDGDKSHQRGLVVPAVHIQKLVDNYRSKSLSN